MAEKSTISADTYHCRESENHHRYPPWRRYSTTLCQTLTTCFQSEVLVLHRSELTQIIEKVQSCLRHSTTAWLPSVLEDHFILSEDKCGVDTIKSGYKVCMDKILNLSHNVVQGEWNSIWKIKHQRR